MFKKLISFLLSCMMLFNIVTPTISNAIEVDSIQASSSENEAATDEFNISNGVLTKYNGTAENVVIPEGVTTIGENVFKDNTQIKSVVIPEGVTLIDDFAFQNCTNLETVSFPDSLKIIEQGVFRNCSSFKNLELPKNLTFIGAGCFRYCYNIGPNLVIPENVTTLGNMTFYGCNNIETVQLPEKFNCIGSLVFAECSSLKTINLPDNLTTIEYQAFKNCSKLGPEIVIPDSVKTISFSVFWGCSSITSVKLPEKLTSIESALFKDCTALKNISIPENVTYIGGSSFENCTSLKNISIPEGVTNIQNGVFKGCTALESVSLPKNITTIYNETFSNCSSLKSLTMPEKLQRIYDEAFINCTSLKNVKLPEGLLSIGKRAFFGCKSIESINIPESTVSLNQEVFYNCSSLNRIFVYSKDVTLPEYTFPVPYREIIYIYGYKGSTAELYPNSFAEDEGGDLIKFIELKDDSSAPDKVANFREVSKTNSKITLSWDKVEDCSGYEIYRYSSNSSKYELLGTITNSETTSYTDKDRLSATTYSYKIRAFKASTSGTVYSEDSDILKVTTRPLKPVFSSSSTTTSTVTLNWKNVARASGYEIYRYSTTNSSYNLIGEVSAGTTTYKDTGRVSANIYTYKVRAYKLVNGKKIYSNYSDSLKVVTKPLTPKVTLSSTVSRSIKVSWTNCSTKATGYEVYMATSNSGTYKLVRTTTSKSYTKTGLTKGKTYYFKVRSYRTVSGEKIYGNYSTVKYIKCK